MARNQARHQKKIMKRRQKSKLRKQQQLRSSSFALLSGRKKILMARTLPVGICLINPSWRKQGMATILIARQQPDGDLALGIFLVDVLCLGLKNTLCNSNISPYRCRTEVVSKTFDETPIKCPPALAHRIIYGAIAYARQFGFEPHRDFHLSQHLLDPPQSDETCEDVEFGRDGKPFYIAGPNDNVQRILRKLQANAGEGHYDYVCDIGSVPAPPRHASPGIVSLPEEARSNPSHRALP